jgi:hypothetical protein
VGKEAVENIDLYFKICIFAHYIKIMTCISIEEKTVTNKLCHRGDKL